MRRWWLPLALLLSVGVNAGILGTLAVQRLRPETPAETGGPAPAGRGSRERVPGAERSPAGERLPGDERPPGELPPEDRPLPLPLLRLADRLGLEGEERERFLAVQRQFFVAMTAERRRLADLNWELRRELLAPEPNEARVRALLAQVGRTYAALEGAMARNVLDSREILDPHQERLFMEFLRRLRAGQMRPQGGGPRQRWQERRQQGPRRWRDMPPQ